MRRLNNIPNVLVIAALKDASSSHAETIVQRPQLRNSLLEFFKCLRDPSNLVMDFPASIERYDDLVCVFANRLRVLL